jgi:glycosyltransferase involved in cell wall biosynthesis
VTFLSHCAQRSGAELAMVRLLAALPVESTVILAEDGPIADEAEAAGALAIVMPMEEVARDVRRDRVRPLSLPLRAASETARYTLRLARHLRETRPDLVHTHSLKAAIYGGVAGRLAGVPVVWHLHDRIDTEHLPAPAVRAVRLLARVLPTQVIANSAATLSTLGVRGGTVVSNPVTLPAATPRRDGPLTIGVVGRIAPWKGQHLFLEAFAEAFADGDARARIVGGVLFGEHEYERSLHQLAARLGVVGRVQFTGHVDDVQSELDQLDVLVHASVLPEPFGQVVVEGLASGLAVVAADAGGPAEIITDGVSGLLYAMGDTGALATRLRELADDPALRARLGAAARNRASDFTPERIVPTVMAVYDRARAAL